MVVLFFVIAFGYLLGKIRIGGFSLGVAAVLFAGLGVSALDPELVLPEIVYELGLVVFIYATGLAAGPGFVHALRRQGWRENVVVVGALAGAGALTVVAATGLGLDPQMATGMFTGAFTNTPALAGVVEALGGTDAEPVVGYSLTYPVGVFGVIAVVSLLERWSQRGRSATADTHTAGVASWTVRVTRDDQPTVASLAARSGGQTQISRLRCDDQTRLARSEDTLARGTLVTVVGEPAALRKVTAWLGERVDAEHLPMDRTQVDSRRVFLSNPRLAGRPLAALDLPDDEMLITRIRRGDTDMVATPDTVLELGDRVRVVGPSPALAQAARLFGDSYHQASEINVLTFAVGIGIGLLLGLIEIPLPGGGAFHLGAAGGTLLVALALGALGRTGPVVWQLPYGVGTTLRQVGVVLFLAGIGTRAGKSLRGALTDPASLRVIAVGAALTMVTAAVVLIISQRLLGLSFAQATGVVAGAQTQPAVLAFGNERYRGDAVNLGYATVYPIAMITKILVAQLVLIALT